MNAGISVAGIGSAAAAPDVAIVEVGVEVVARSVVDARGLAAGGMGAVVEVLRGHGLDDTATTTTEYGIHAEYDHHEGRRLRGYRVNNMLQVRITNLDSLAAVIDGVAAADDHVVVRGLRFAHADQTELESKARKAAWADAYRRATELAELAGVQLGGVVAAAENRGGGGPAPMRAMALESTMATPIESGELAVVVNLAVEFAIES